MGVPGLAHALHRVIKGPRSLVVCIQRAEGDRVWRRHKLLLQSLSLDETPITSAYTLLERIESHGHPSVPGRLGKPFGWDAHGLSHALHFSAPVGVFLGDTHDPLTFPFRTPNLSRPANQTLEALLGDISLCSCQLLVLLFQKHRIRQEYSKWEEVSSL